MLATAHSAIAAVDRLKETGRAAHQDDLHPGLPSRARAPSPRSIPTCRYSRRRSMPSSTITGILSPALATRETACSAPSSRQGKGGETPMSPGSQVSLFSVVLCFVQVLIAASGANQEVGLTDAGRQPRGPARVLTGCAGRARRAHLNMIENMVLFAALVLIAAVAGKANATTAMGAMIFFWAPARLCRDLPGRRSLAAHARLVRVGDRHGHDRLGAVAGDVAAAPVRTCVMLVQARWAPIACTSSSTSMLPAFSNTRVTGTLASLANGALSSMNMMCNRRASASRWRRAGSPGPCRARACA